MMQKVSNDIGALCSLPSVVTTMKTDLATLPFSFNRTGNCRSIIPNRFIPSAPLYANSSGGVIHVFENYSIACSGRVTAVDLFVSLETPNDVTWNDTLTVNLTILEADVLRDRYTRKAMIPLSVNKSEINVTGASAYGSQTTLYYIPLLNLNSVGCNTSVKITDSPDASIFCYGQDKLPPFIITFAANHTGEETST